MQGEKVDGIIQIGKLKVEQFLRPARLVCLGPVGMNSACSIIISPYENFKDCAGAAGCNVLCDFGFGPEPGLYFGTGDEFSVSFRAYLRPERREDCLGLQSQGRAQRVGCGCPKL